MNIETLFQQAKEEILRKGDYCPMLFAELESGEPVMVLFADFPFKTALERQVAFFGLGRKLGAEHPGVELQQVCFLMEAWYTTYPVGEKSPNVSPSLATNRKEAIVASVLEVIGKSIKQTMYAAELIRDGDGHLINLEAMPDAQDAQSPLMTAFLAGYVSYPVANLHASGQNSIKKKGKGKNDD